MASNPKQPTPPHAGVGPHNTQPGVSSETDRLKTEDMLIWNDIDFSKAVPDAFIALAKMAIASAGGSGPSTIQSLPTEMLMKIVEELSPPDRVSTAFAFPDLFLNVNKFHMFYHDAHAQLAIPTYRVEGSEQQIEQGRQPLLLEAIPLGLSVEQIEFMLKAYEEVCLELGVNHHAFLNSDFPDNRPEDQRMSDVEELAPGPGSSPDPAFQNSPDSSISIDSQDNPREMFTPLHVAVASARLDIVQLLLKQGADVERSVVRDYIPPSTPLEYALWRLTPGAQYFYEISEADRPIVVEIAAELVQHSPFLSAYSLDFQPLTREMFLATEGGAEAVVMTLLMRNSPVINHQQLERDRATVLELILQNRRPMPHALRYILEDGAQFMKTNGFLYRTCGSMATAAMTVENIQHAVIALRWEVEHNCPTLLNSIDRLCSLAVSDKEIVMVGALSQVLDSLNQEETLVRLFLMTFADPMGDTLNTRDMLLRNTNIVSGTTLRFSIVFSDRRSIAYIISQLIARGRSIDEKLPPFSLLNPDSKKGHWHETPLTYALSLNRYDAAAELLSVGADLTLVPPNIRHRVRRLRDRINSKLITDLVDLVYYHGNMPPADTSRPTQKEAFEALDYVFSRMLDDPARPMPFYTRPRYDYEVSEDHPDNDSDDEDQDHNPRILIGMLSSSHYPWRMVVSNDMDLDDDSLQRDSDDSSI